MSCTIPICYMSSTNIVGQAIVDQEYHYQLSQFTWYLSDTRKPAPPRITIRIPHPLNSQFLVTKHITMNRLVYLLATTNPELHDRLLTPASGDYTRLVNYTSRQSFQRLLFNSTNPWDCRIDNINTAISTRSSKARILSATPPPDLTTQRPTPHYRVIPPQYQVGVDLAAGQDHTATTPEDTARMKELSRQMSGDATVDRLKALFSTPETDTSTPRTAAEAAKLLDLNHEIVDDGCTDPAEEEMVD